MVKARKIGGIRVQPRWDWTPEYSREYAKTIRDQHKSQKTPEEREWAYIERKST